MERNISLDILKLLMAFMVVGIHTTFLIDISPLLSAVTVEGLFRIAVPMFLLINGYFFYDSVQGGKSSTWFKRVAILYIIWMAIYSPFWFDTSNFDINWIKRFINQVVLGFFHLWYISGMLFAAAALIVIRRFPPYLLISIVVITFISGVIIQYLGNYHVFENTKFDTIANKPWYHRNGLFTSLPFFLLGYLLRQAQTPKKMSLSQVRLGIFIGLALLVSESLMNFAFHTLDEGIDNIFSSIILCPLLFIYFIKLNISGNTKNIALYASSIYFIHFFVMLIINKNLEITNTLNTLIVLLASAALSYFLIMINRKVKYIL